MKNRRGSLWGAGAEEMVLQFKAGDVVKPVIVSGIGFTGVVRDVDSRINKVWVAWGNGSMTQHDPDEVQLAVVQDPTVKARMASGRRVKQADASFFADRVTVGRPVTRRGSSSARKATDIEEIVESEERLAPGDSSQTKFLSKEMERKLNEQVGVEFYSAYLYFIVAAWFQSKGLVGFQAWMERQGNDEVEHGMKVFKYLMDTGSKVDLPAVPAPKVDLSSVAEATRAVLDHEMLVTRLWKDIGEIAKGEPNLATQELAQWFMTEQVEEEDGALTLHQRVQMADTGTGIIVLDNDLKDRDPNEATA